MKIPSILKTPKYQRFTITPRYYDPVKEEIDERTERIRKELTADSGEIGERSASQSRIAGAFRGAKRTRRGSAGFMQMVIVMLLTGGLVGYLYFGNIALYVFLIVSSVLLYLKMKRII